MNALSTHILDTSNGLPAAGVKVTYRADGAIIASAVTNSDGRILDLLNGTVLTAGNHTLTFAVGPYFLAQKQESFFNDINVDFVVIDVNRNYHVPLLLSPFSFTTYRGS
ncbi:MAG: hydroxyisourate hydrolase [Candidatus Planktophila sp.]|nr:hydroxyisourate hydrolase [Candidatus Planktophila sp.]